MIQTNSSKTSAQSIFRQIPSFSKTVLNVCMYICTCIRVREALRMHVRVNHCMERVNPPVIMRLAGSLSICNCSCDTTQRIRPRFSASVCLCVSVRGHTLPVEAWIVTLCNWARYTCMLSVSSGRNDLSSLHTCVKHKGTLPSYTAFCRILDKETVDSYHFFFTFF